MPSFTRSNQRIISEADWADPDSIAHVAREMTLTADYKERMERLAVRNRSLLFGDHWHVWSKTKNKMVSDPKREGILERLVYNDILLTVEQRAAKFQRQNRVWSTMVGTEDLGDKLVQRITDKVMEWEWRVGCEMQDEVLPETLQWAMSSGIVFCIPSWDKNKGPIIRTTVADAVSGAGYLADPEEQERYIRQQQNWFFNQFGNDAFQQGFYEGPTGGCRVDVAPIFEMFYWPHTATRMSEVEVWCWERKKSVSSVAAALGVPQEEIRDKASPRSDDGHSMRGGGRWNGVHFQGQDYTSDDSIYVKTLWKVPDSNWPKGREMTILGQAGSPVGEPTDLQNGLNEAPVVQLVEKRIRGHIYGTCTVDQMYHAQQEVNHSLSQAAAYRSTRTMPTVINYEANGPHNKALSTRPGKTWTIPSPATNPTAFKMPDVPMDHFRTAQENRVWMSRLGGTASIDVGATDDADVRSGRAIGMLKELNDQRLIPFGQAINAWASKIGNFVLTFNQANILTERALHLVGDDSRYELVKFKGADLQPSNYGQESYNKNLINVDVFSIVPDSPGELRQTIDMALERGLLDPAADRNEIWDMLGHGNMRKMFDATRLDRNKQAQEIDQWENGQPVAPPKGEDDDAVHLRIINRWKLTDAYELAVFENPEVAPNIEQHIMAHKIEQAKKALEPQYEMRRADVSLWMQHRSQMLEQLGTAPPGATEEQQIAMAVQAMELTNLVFPAPLSAVVPQEPGQQQRGGSGRKSESPGRAKKTSGPENQGVPKEQQA